MSQERIFEYIAEGCGAPEAGETREEFKERMARKQSFFPASELSAPKEGVPLVIDRLTGLPIGQEKD